MNVLVQVLLELVKARVSVDVSFPSGTTPFGSAMLQPGAVFYHTFDRPGTYHYVCVVHETGGMKGTVTVRPSPLVASSLK